MSYGRFFYKSRRQWALGGAEGVLPVVLDLVQPNSITDVGCGTGIWLRVARNLGIEDVWGIDGPWVREDQLEIPADRFAARELGAEWAGAGKTDLVISVEVGEHLPPAAAKGFVRNLCECAPVVLFSAAIPGQGGQHHVNERWPGYWISLFEAEGWEVYDVVRPRVWNEESIPYWYRQNCLLFVAPDAPEALRSRLEAARRAGDFCGTALVHPRHAERALQFPGIRALLRAFPYALVRSAAQLNSGAPVRLPNEDSDPPFSPAVVRRLLFALLLVAGLAALAAAVQGAMDHRSKRTILKLYENNRNSADAELVYVDSMPPSDPPPFTVILTHLVMEDGAEIVAEFNDNGEDFFVVDEGDAGRFEQLARGRILVRVGEAGGYVLYRDPGVLESG